MLHHSIPHVPCCDTSWHSCKKSAGGSPMAHTWPVERRWEKFQLLMLCLKSIIIAESDHVGVVFWLRPCCTVEERNISSSLRKGNTRLLRGPSVRAAFLFFLCDAFLAPKIPQLEIFFPTCVTRFEDMWEFEDLPRVDIRAIGVPRTKLVQDWLLCRSRASHYTLRKCTYGGSSRQLEKSTQGEDKKYAPLRSEEA